MVSVFLYDMLVIFQRIVNGKFAETASDAPWFSLAGRTLGHSVPEMAHSAIFLVGNVYICIAAIML